MKTKRFEVVLVIGCDIDPVSPPCLIYDSESHFFDTYEQASEFANGYQKDRTTIYDHNEDIPF